MSAELDEMERLKAIIDSSGMMPAHQAIALEEAYERAKERALKWLVKTAREAEIPCAECGETAIRHTYESSEEGCIGFIWGPMPRAKEYGQ